jgi:drug/metabolite transporter (DMT)-like permease
VTSTQLADALRRERIGLLCDGLCAVNGAFVPAFAKLTTNRGTPLFVATVTTLFAGCFAGALLLLKGEWRPMIERDTGWRLALIGALATGVAFTLFYNGVQRSTAVETALCLQIEPLYSLIAAWAFLGHRPDRRRIAATACILAGIVFAVGTRGLSASSGVWLLMVTPVCWQASHLVVLRGLRGVSPPVLTAARYVYGSLVLVPCALLSGDLTAPRSDLASSLSLLALQGVILSYVGTLFWYQAVTRLDLARTTAIVVPSTPVLSLLASFALLREVPTANQCVGMGLIASGVLAFATAPDASRAPSVSAEELRNTA